MFNDLCDRRFRYNESDGNAVKGELEATAAGFCEEIDRTGSEHCDRLVTRLPNEHRTARWLVRQPCTKVSTTLATSTSLLRP